MKAVVSGVDSKSAPVEPVLRTLATRGDLPVRARNLLEGMLGVCSNDLVGALITTLDDTDQQLFRLAEQSRDNDERRRCFESLREIKRGRADVTPRFMLAIEDQLARLDRDEPSAPVPTAAARPGAPQPRMELSLVDTHELEQSLALQEFAAKCEIRQAQVLFALGHRFGVIAGAPVFEADALPIGPANLAHALQYACSALDINVDHRVLLFRSFDRIANAAIGTVYETINTYLIEHGILRHLPEQPTRLKAKPDKEAAAEAEAATPLAEADTPPPAYGAQTSQAMPVMRTPSSAQPRSDAPAPAPGAQTIPADERDAELFTTLRELLAGRRSAIGLAPTRQADSFVPSDTDVQSVLGSLQAKPISPMLSGGKRVQRSVANLKQDMLAQLRQLAPAGKAPQLAAEDSDTIDLVGMLFDYIAKSVRPDGGTQALMTKLQVPLLRVALRDKSFFTRRSHPARQLLNAIAETGSHWIDDSEGPADRALVDKMQMVVDRITQQFDGDMGVFEDMLGGLSQHMHTLARKAEVAERRHVDAAKGRERLLIARERAGHEIAVRVATARPNKLVRTVLEQAWADVLALTLLRQGEDSTTYKRRLEVADQLVSAGAGRSGDGKPPLALRGEIENGLSQVGYHQDDIQMVVKRLFMPEEAQNEENPSSNTEIAIKLKSRPRLGDDGSNAVAAPASPLRPKAFAPGSEEARMLERLKTLPFGTWFEFRTNQQGDTVRRKLAWFSTLTGRCLFVNQRGVRADERMLEQLTRDIINGQASIVEAEQETLVDRAWKGIVASLKQVVGRDPAPVPA